MTHPYFLRANGQYTCEGTVPMEFYESEDGTHMSCSGWFSYKPFKAEANDVLTRDLVKPYNVVRQWYSVRGIEPVIYKTYGGGTSDAVYRFDELPDAVAFVESFGGGIVQ